jgi:hypothetical protein
MYISKRIKRTKLIIRFLIETNRRQQELSIIVIFLLIFVSIFNSNREAKTKFVFEPEKGIIKFEQKLPISWHSFNERPNYEVKEKKSVT